MYSVSPSPFKQALDWKPHAIVEMFKMVVLAPKLNDRWITATTMVRIMKAHPTWSGPLTVKSLNNCLAKDKVLKIGFGVADGDSNGTGIYRKHRQCAGGIKKYAYYAASYKNARVGTTLISSEEQQMDVLNVTSIRRTTRSQVEPGRDDKNSPTSTRTTKSAQMDVHMVTSTRRTTRSQVEPGRDDKSTPTSRRTTRSSNMKRKDPETKDQQHKKKLKSGVITPIPAPAPTPTGRATRNSDHETSTYDPPRVLSWDQIDAETKEFDKILEDGVVLVLEDGVQFSIPGESSPEGDPKVDLDEVVAAEAAEYEIRHQFDAAENAIMLPVDPVEETRASLHEEVTVQSPVIVRPPPAVDIWTSSEARYLFNMQTGKFTSNPS